MKHIFVRLAFFGFLLATIPSSSQADPPKFPDFPDAPNPGGEGGGGDNVPYIPHVYYFLTLPIITDARVFNNRVHFRFFGTGPIMRYNIVWSRPGKEETDMRWTKVPITANNSAGEEYIINEYPVWNTDYSFRVQSESKNTETHPDGVVWRYQITPFVEKTFHTPPNPAISDRIDEFERHGPSTTAPKPNPFSGKVDDRVRLIPHPIIKK
ncbi:MAG: hypothetical protein PHE55_11815 [Methylococcaceae bacterium]|nr:hypothetical protein [Methylococcaceae bacterium]